MERIEEIKKVIVDALDKEEINTINNFIISFDKLKERKQIVDYKIEGDCVIIEPVKAVDKIEVNFTIEENKVHPVLDIIREWMDLIKKEKENIIEEKS